MTMNIRLAFDPKFRALRDAAKHQVDTASPLNALNAAKRLYEAFPNQSESNLEMARALARVGKILEAMPFAEKAHKLDPNNPTCIMVLGRIYLNFRLYEFAAPLLFQAVNRLPQSMLIQWAMADFYFGVGDGKKAVTHFENALALKPNSQQRAAILLAYIKCLATTESKEEAEQRCAELGQLEGFEIQATVRASTLRKYKDSDKIAQELIEIAKNNSVPAELRSDAKLSIGNMYNHNKKYDEAFEWWTASRESKNITRRKEIGRDKVELIKSFYPPELFHQAKAFGNPSTLPVFVVGMVRSGTTLTEQIISSHADGHGVGELGRVGMLEPQFRIEYGSKPNVAAIVKNAKNKELKLRGDETLKLLAMLSPPGKKRIVDKMPTQYFDMGYALLCFPNAKIIHTQRHPADSFVSAYQNNMSQFHEYSFNQELYAETYLAKQAIMAHWKECFPTQIFDLRYESLVAKPEETVRRILEFLELPWDENCMKFFEQGRTIKTLSQDQVRNPIYTSSVYRWKNYEKHLGPLFAALKAANFEYPDV